ncbi:MAG TPA: hypothetical protein VGG71_06185, partial [Chitinophagaceae bacterium]
MKTKIYITGFFISLIAIKSTAQSANTSLSNLTAPTKVNVNVLPDKNGKHDLGSGTKSWNNIYFHGSWFKDSIQFFSSDISNLFFGNTAGENNSGSYNTAFGIDAFANHKTRDYNTAVGYQAMQNDSAGFENTAVGESALQFNKTGGDNVAVGSGALISNTAGYQNTVTGAGAMYHNTSGYDNIATGYEALSVNTSGFRNIAIGDHSL